MYLLEIIVEGTGYNGIKVEYCLTIKSTSGNRIFNCKYDRMMEQFFVSTF